MSTLVVIPARYASTRYPGKPLALLTLPDGSRKSLTELSWMAAMRVPRQHSGKCRRERKP